MTVETSCVFHMRMTRSSRLQRTVIGALCLALVAACGAKGDAKSADANAADAKTADGKSETRSDSVEGGRKAEDGAKEESRAIVTATIATVKAESFIETIDASGVVSARTGHFASLSAPAPTRVTAVNVTLGARVHRGDKLVSFETTGFDAAVLSADAALNAAEQNEARARRLVDAGVSPRKDVEFATAEAASARSISVNAHRAQQLAVLQSPIDGVITRLNAVLSANVDVGQALVEIADTQTLDVQLVLSPALATKVHVGQSATFRDGSSSDATEAATGKVADVAGALDSATRSVIVRVSVSNQKRTLRIGESLYGQIAAGTHTGAIVIPDDALVPTGEGFQVFVVDAEGKAHARPVKIGARAEHRVWISDGLKPGENIVTVGAFGMDDGATVVTRKASSP